MSVEPFCSFPCSCRPHRVRPAPRPVAARECPLREALQKVLCSRGTRSEPLCCFRRLTATASSTPTLRVLITARCLPTGLVPLPPACLQVVIVSTCTLFSCHLHWPASCCAAAAMPHDVPPPGTDSRSRCHFSRLLIPLNLLDHRNVSLHELGDIGGPFMFPCI